MMQLKSKKRRSLSRRILIQIAVLTVIVTFIIVFVSYRSMKTTYQRQLNEQAQEIVRLLAKEIDGDALDRYVKTGRTDAYYEALKRTFSDVKYDMTGVEYLYLFKPFDDHFVYIVEGAKPDDDPSTISQLGDVYEYAEPEYRYLVPDVEAARASTALIVSKDVNYGYMITAWAPVLNSEGLVAGMVEADCSLRILDQSIRENILWGLLALIACMVFLSLLVHLILQRSVTRPVGQMTKMVDSYKNGSFSEAKLRYEDEFSDLAASFVDMTRRIDTYTDAVAQATARQERLSAEFEMAKQIQTDILPRDFPALPGHSEFDIAASIELAREISGDFFDYFLLDEDHLVMVLGDISDHGVPAALVMVIVKTLIKDRTMQGYSPADVLQYINEQLLESNQAGIFCMAWLAVLELSTGKGVAVNAGHEHPALHRAGKRFEMDEYRHFPPVGALEETHYRDHGFQLEPGDTLFIYSDGVKDAVNERSELFGLPRILEALNREPEATPSVIMQTMKESLGRFGVNAEKADAMAMLALKYYGPEGARDMW